MSFVTPEKEKAVEEQKEKWIAWREAAEKSEKAADAEVHKNKSEGENLKRFVNISDEQK